jgi:SAM-dependent methyltransferase
MNTKKEWFSYWFDTPYYHILYKDRDDTDARIFMQNITSFLKLPNQTHILDLACGKGRHAVFLNSLGYTVTGVDLSENSILSASSKANDRLNFKVHDMRDSFSEKYDAIFNLFTSFGYFEDDAIDIKIVQNIKEGLHTNGIAVIDFLNVVTAKANLIPYEIKTIDQIDFHIHKKIENGFIIKEISFEDKGKKHSYFERVKYLDIHKFTTYFEKSELKIKHVFGDYDLSSYNENTSKRLIFVVSK